MRRIVLGCFLVLLLGLAVPIHAFAQDAGDTGVTEGAVTGSAGAGETDGDKVAAGLSNGTFAIGAGLAAAGVVALITTTGGGGSSTETHTTPEHH